MKPIRSYHKRQAILNQLAIVVMASMLAFASGSGVAAMAESAVQDSQPDPKALWTQCFGDDQAHLGYHALTGKLDFVGTQADMPIKQPIQSLKSVSPAEAARGYLSRCGSFFGLQDQADELAVKRQSQVEGGRSVIRFQQRYRGIPVFAGELVVQLTAANDILLINGEILPDINVAVEPTVTAPEAQSAGLKAVTDGERVDAGSLKVSRPELWIYNPELIKDERGATSLVWRMEVASKALAPIRYLVLVNATDGSVVLSINQVDTAKNRMTYTADNSILEPGTLVCTESNPNCTGGDKDAVNAHVYAGDTYNFYHNYHGRDSIDNHGMTLISTVHYDVGYCNAFWNGAQMTYGDGCFIVADDVVAHELTHGVTEHESGLVYAYESGAINESLSDVWGEFVDLTNGKGTDTAAVRWVMGEDTSTGAIRNMKNPTVFGDPDRMGSPYYYNGGNDNGGVHTNSGVNNKAAYLMTDGGTFNGYTITGIGITKVAKIYYEVQTNILTSGSNYSDLGNALFQACNNLVGTSGITTVDCTQVQKATFATEMKLTVPAPANDDFGAAVAISSLPYTSPALDTRAATTAGDDPSFTCVSSPKYNTVWYRYTPTQTGTVTVDTASSNYGTVLAVYTGTRGSLTSIICGDDTATNQVSYAATAGVTYYFEVGSYFRGGGKLTFHAAVGAPKTWAIKAPMSAGRGWLGAAAVNGKVYVIGGDQDSFGSQTAENDGIPILDGRLQTALKTSVEVYDPSSNTWASGASKPTAVATTGAAAINGKIYVPGGWNGSTALSIVEVYNPATNSWSRVAPMPAPLFAYGVTALNGKLYVIGGSEGYYKKNTCYVYNPATNAWSTCAALPSARYMLGTGVINSKIYVVGGFDSGDNELNTVSEYNPATNTWTAKRPMKAARGGPGVVGYGNFFYVCGGGWEIVLSSCEKYDAGTNSWSAFDSLNFARYALAMVQLNGKLFAEGGYIHGTYSSANEESASLRAIHQISGHVGVPGVSLSYGGGSTSTDGSGNYSFTVTDGWSGTVTPSKIGYTFSPANRTYTNVTGDQTGQNYRASTAATYRSGGAQDGWILETGEASNLGGSWTAAATTFNLGDDKTRKQYRSILSFTTSGLPDNAVITKATLTLRRQSISGGGNPVSMFQGLLVDIRKGFFGTSVGLQAGDFQVAASKSAKGPYNPTSVGTLYTINLDGAAFAYINKAATNEGVTQLRLRFKLDDNNNAAANFISFFSGNYVTAASRPTLTIRYYMP